MESSFVEVKSNGVVSPKTGHNKRVPYEHQRKAMKCLDVMDKETSYSTLVVLPTGGGKTYTASMWLLRHALNRHRKILWIAHRQTLLEQAAESFQKYACAEFLPNVSSFRYRIVSGASSHDRAIDIVPNDQLLIYEIVAPGGKVHKPPEGRCWSLSKKTFEELLADGRIYFGKDNNSQPNKIRYLSEVPGVAPWTWWPSDEVGHTDSSKKEIMALFGKNNIFDTPKPETLVQRIIHIATNPGDLVLDSFLGSGTTAAVAHKMGRRWIGVEMGEHAYTHCKTRLDKVIAGEDQGGVTKAENWNGSGGYRFFELAPTLINRDEFGEEIINPDYDANMLAAAVALHEGFTYQPDETVFWKQSRANEGAYLFVTTRHVTADWLESIQASMNDGEFLSIACRSYGRGLERLYRNITISKIPQMLLERCEFGRSDYNLNIVHPPIYDDEDE